MSSANNHAASAHAPAATERWQRHRRLHLVVWKMLRKTLTWPMVLRYHYRYKPTPLPDEPYLLFSNHVTYADPFLLASSLKQQMYYVASEHLVRSRLGWVMNTLAAPILRQKSKTETQAALDILRRLKHGANVCVFVEGERSYSGRTEHIPDSAAHLALMSGAHLVTFRLENGYLIDPRWCRGLRHGRMSGRVVNVYSPQQMQQLGREQLLAHIRADLAEDAFAAQRQQERSFPGKRLAEYLETALWRCPDCGQVGQLHSEGDFFRCDCGLTLRFTAQGWLETVAGNCPFDNVADWFAWQLESLPAWLEQCDPAQPLLADEAQQLYSCNFGDNHPRLLGQGSLSLYTDRLEFSSPEFNASWPLAEIGGMSNSSAMLLSFSHGAELYEVRSPHPRSGIKYPQVHGALKQRH